MTPIDVLHDDVLLEIFYFCVAGASGPNSCPNLTTKRAMKAWQSLVHVCRRWRSLVFGSPRRLDLRLFFTPRMSARQSLDVWPAFPLEIWGKVTSTSVDSIVVALEHSDRVFRIRLGLKNDSLEWDKILAALEVPFPELTSLSLQSELDDETLSPAIPDWFLGGSAPHL